MAKKCLECGSSIEERVYKYSIEKFGYPLCREDQDWIIRMARVESTEQVAKLYLALRDRGVPAEMEKFDGHKTIDIAIPEARVNIEVDGGQHNWSSSQALSDLRRTYYSFQKGYLTLRIPNTLVNHYLEETADMIEGILAENRDKNRKY